MKKTLLALVAILCFTFAASAADISGKWIPDPSAGGGGRGGAQTWEFKVAGTTLTGSLSRAGRGGGDPVVITIQDGKLNGNDISFNIMQPGRGGGDPTKVVYSGKVEGDKITLSFDMGRGAQSTTLVKAP